ncbi:MAG TPA: hypothetical protein DDY61_00295 [Ruminococcaceae bacterium]|nr:hypothetical protein [Oscillospiraceae bacterium]
MFLLKDKYHKIVCCFMILVILASSLLNLSAAPAADIPSTMLDNIYLDALTYTGYKTDAQKADGSIFKTYSGNAPASVRSGIGYGTGPSGLETVAAGNKTGKAPDIAKFKANGLCCASYVSYVYYNYLPNIARMDVSKIPQPANPRSPISYNSAVENWVKSGGARRIAFTQGTNSFTPSEEIPIGSLIIFKHKTTGEIAHLALYAGYYAGKHFVTHVGNERGPEISTVEGMSKGSYPEVVTQVVVPVVGEPVGTISVYKTDENGKPLAGAKFKATMAEHPEYSFLIDPTDENGNGKMNMGLPYGKYILTEIEFPEGYTYSGQKEYTVEICDETQFVTVRAVNRLKSSKLTVIKVDSETGQTVKGVTGFKIKNLKTNTESETYYTDENGFLTLPDEITYGDYELTEITPPKGYTLNSVPIAFSIDGNTPEVVIRLSDKPEKGKISVLKRGEMFSSVTETDGIYTPVYSERGLKGAEFEVTAAEDIYTADGTLRISKGALADTLVTDESGKAVSKELYPGKYLLREISAPEGYILNAEPREITVVSGITSAEIFNKRKKQEYTIQKNLETDQKFGIGFNGEILNIRFGLFSKTELTALDGSVIPADGLIEIASPDEDGALRFTADMPYNAECYIKELETDEHYILSDEQYLSGDTAENKIIRGSIEGLKTDPNGRVLKGAVIGLFYPFETEFSLDTAIETFETDEAGRFSFKDVPYGEWIIRELKAPDGYILSEENYTVTVKENGETVKLNIKNSKIPEPPSAPESPKTGDTANLLIPSAVLFTALAVIIFLSKKFKKEGNINE